MSRNTIPTSHAPKRLLRSLHSSSRQACEALERRMLLAAVPILRGPSALTSAPAGSQIAPTPIGTIESGSAPDLLPNLRSAGKPYQWPVGPELRVNSYVASSQYAPSMAMDADGNYVVVWDSYGQDGAYGGVYAQRYNASGAAQGAEFRVNTAASLNEVQPSVAMDPDGDFVVAWTSGLYNYYTGQYAQYDVRAQRYSAAGVPQGTEFVVNTFTDSSQFSPALAMDAAGNFAVTWTSNHQDTFYSSVYAQRFNASGVRQGTEVHVNTGTQGEFYSDIAMDTAGDYVITWSAYGRDGSGFAAYGQRFSAVGVRQGLEFRVNSFTTGDQRDPTLAMDSNGDFVIAWSSYGQLDQTPDVFAQRYNAAGVRQGTEFRVNGSTFGYQSSPSAAMDAIGNFVVSWNGLGDTGGGIYARRFDAGGAAVAADFHVNSSGNIIAASVVAVDSGGDFVTAWQSDQQDGSSYGVYAQRYTTFGAAQVATIGDRVWNDADANGIQNAGEPGLAGATVQLYNSDAAFVSSVTTDASGHYSFSALAGASAFVRFPPPTGYLVTRSNQGADDAIDSDVNTASYRTPTFTVGAAGTSNNSFDAGFTLPASVNGVVFNDRNGNGTRDSGEEGLAGFQVFVDLGGDGVRDADEPVATTSFTASFSFANVLGGAYQVIALDQDLWDEPAGAPVAIPPGVATTVNVPVRTTVPDKSIAPQGPEFRVNSYTTGEQHASSIAMDAVGNFVVAWTGSGEGDADGIFAQRYNAAGVKQGTEFRANSFTTGDQTEPAAAMDADGDFVVTWRSVGQDGSEGGIYSQRYNASGVKQGGEARVNTYTTGNQISPSAAMDPAGDFVVTWQSDLQDGSFWGVYAQRYNAAGVAQGSAFRANVDTTLSEAMPSVGMDATGDFVIAWSKGYNGYYGIPYDVYARRYDASGAAQGTEFRVSTPGDTNTTPTVAVDADGDFVVAWASGYNTYYGPRSDVFAQRYNRSGTAQGAVFRVNTITSQAYTPVAAMNADGDLVVTWKGAGIIAQRYNAAGVKQGAELRVNTNTAGSKSDPSAAIDAAGNFVIAWDGIGQDGSGSGVYAQRYAAFGAVGAVTIGDRVWNDTNGNGIQDSGEPGIAGARVELYTGDGVFAAAATTDATGHYTFSAFAGASLYLQFITPTGLIPTAANQGINDNLDSDADRNTGTTPAFTVGAAGTGDVSFDAGFVAPASISTVVFNDRNRNGVRDGGEEPLAGFTAFLDLDLNGTRGANEPIAETDWDGSFRFEQLLPATYSIVLVHQDQWVEPAQPAFALPASASLTRNLSVHTAAPDSASRLLGSEFRVNTYTTETQSSPVIATDAAGDFVVAWNSYLQDGSSWGVYAQRYNAAGVKQGNEFRVNTQTTGVQFSTSVAMDTNGDFVIAWFGAGSNDSYGVFAQRYNAAGVKQGNNFRVNTYTSDKQYRASSAMDANGNFVITWDSVGQDGSDVGVYAQRYNATGVAQGSEFRVTTYTTGDQSSPSASMDSAGDFVIAWSGAGQGDILGTFAQRFNAAGAPQGAEFRVNTSTTDSQSNASTAMDAAGNFVIAWTGADTGGSYDSFAQRFNAIGVKQGSEVRVNSYTTGSQYGANVAMDAAGDFVVVWRSAYQDGSVYGAYAQRYNAAGVRQEGEFRVNAYTQDQQRLASAAMDADGDFVLTWTSYGQDGSRASVYAQRYNVATRPAVTSSQIVWNAAPQRIEISFDQDVSASLSSADVLLENLTTGTTVPTSSILRTWNTATKTASFSFPTLPNGGALPNGNYQLTLLAAGVNNATGTTIVADYVISFFFLNGDANHDRLVDVSDLGILATNWQASGKTFAQGDFNYDGVVDVSDLGILATNWQISLPELTGLRLSKALLSIPFAQALSRVGLPAKLSRSVKIATPLSALVAVDQPAVPASRVRSELPWL
jgi:hypothetical protein